MNFSAILPLISSVLFMALGLFVFLNNPRSRLNQTFGLTCLVTFWWQFSWFILFTFNTENLAKLMVYVGYTGIIFIPYTFYHFFITFLKKNKEKKLVLFAYILGVIFLTVNWASKLFIKGYYKYSWGYYPKAGPTHLIYLFSLFYIAIRVTYLLFKELSEAKSSPFKYNQVKYVLLAFIIYTFAAFDFAMNYGLGIYPIGVIFILISLGIMAYSIVKYRLLDINLVLTRAGIFVIVYTLVLGIPFWLGFKYELWKYSTLIMLVLATLGPLIYTKLRHQVEARLQAEEHHAHELLRQAAEGMVRYRHIKELLGLIVHITCKTLKLDNASVFLLRESAGNYHLAAVRQKSKYHYSESLSNQDPLVQKLSVLKEPLVYEEVKLKAQEEKNKPEDPIHEIESQMRQLQAAVIVPAISKERLLGLLLLGEKKTKRMYSPEDLATLWALSYQAALAIENALLYQKEKTWLSEQSRRQALADMAPGASHQFDNRLIAISSTAENLLDLISNDSANLSKEQVIETVSADLKVIVNEVMKGKQITEAILQKAKVKLEFDQVDIVKVIQNAINLTRLRRTRESFGGAKEPQIEFHYLPELPPFTLCEGPMQDVFENMFNNAIDAIVAKDNRKIEPLDYQGKININALRQDRSLVITIEDNGMGIPKENLHKLFTPYFTSKATSEKGVVGGSGLGLWVMRDFVERHGGTIAVESEYTKWTRFTITLPLNFKPSE